MAENRNARADADKLDMRDRAQAAEERLEFFIAQQQRIPAAQQHVANGGRAPDVINLLLEVRMKIMPVALLTSRERVQ